MKINGPAVLRVLATGLLLAAAVMLGYSLWQHYMYSPWTRDGRVRADVISIAADVSGPVAQVPVRDNQEVRKGDLLFAIDPERFRQAVAQAEAQVRARKAELDLRQQQARRRMNLDSTVVSAESREDVGAQEKQARANYEASLAALDSARLNLRRSEVYAPVDGYVTNLNLHGGDYVSAGAARMALIDKHSYWVYGYFEETKLPNVHVGARAEVRLLAGGKPLSGHVESIARGIADRDNPTSANLLADVNPVFTWIRLAQRVPVRIRLDALPDDLPLAMGTTCTVTILTEQKSRNLLK
ncbi:HlyD family secretion protein [Cupriavidus sp. MP-37]|uniref:efflux RND transporter periplasmic adaptor subunit n=1 Tax=Cupriavidus sp. MP-37 TaxID=2884455 RepID=UPI001D0B73B7|nr:HlyD family secretion protein [Cupriavidus sp. MP-37]UDM54059.1 HlyD family secretion protein [Cupriavidus sp. MP-37]